jgi:hypothetical protein
MGDVIHIFLNVLGSRTEVNQWSSCSLNWTALEIFRIIFSTLMVRVAEFLPQAMISTVVSLPAKRNKIIYAIPNSTAESKTLFLLLQQLLPMIPFSLYELRAILFHPRILSNERRCHKRYRCLKDLWQSKYF